MYLKLEESHCVISIRVFFVYFLAFFLNRLEQIYAHLFDTATNRKLSCDLDPHDDSSAWGGILSRQPWLKKLKILNICWMKWNPYIHSREKMFCKIPLHISIITKCESRRNTLLFPLWRKSSASSNVPYKNKHRLF